jgi:hypothetical protein
LKLRDAAIAKPQAICGAYWTVDRLKMEKSIAILEWKAYQRVCQF